MSAAKLWLRVFLAGFSVIVALLMTTLFTTQPYGDLTRVALLSDYKFGWQVNQPDVPDRLRAGTPINQADILVLGDSFSMSFNWQTALVDAGYKVATIYWGSYGDKVCSDFDRRVREAGFKGKLIVVESVEYLLQGRLDRSEQCGDQQFAFASTTKPAWQMTSSVPDFSLDWGAKLLSGVKTYRNTHRAEQGEIREGLRLADVRNVTDGCAYFSNRQCSRIPFLSADLDNKPLDRGTVDQMQRFMARHARTPMLWMVIPNKSTVYLEPSFSSEFVRAMKEARLGPDLFAFSAQQRSRVIDFYQPNDTHMSIRGLLTLGPVMLDAVRAKLGAEARPAAS